MSEVAPESKRTETWQIDGEPIEMASDHPTTLQIKEAVRNGDPFRLILETGESFVCLPKRTSDYV